MKIVVCVKRVASLGDDFEFTEGGSDVDGDYVDWALNEWDSYALEEALRLRDAAGQGEVVVLTAGGKAVEEVLVRGLAMGADRAVRVWSDFGAVTDPLSVAAALAVALRAEQPGLVLCGALSSDSGYGAIAAALAGSLDLPCAAAVTRIEFDPAARAVIVHRELEGGVTDVVDVTIPAVVSLQTGINRPRYVTMRAIQQAQDAQISVVALDVMPEPASYVRRMFVPESRNAEMLDGDEAAVARRIVEIVAGALA